MNTNAATASIPLVILGGADRCAVRLPEQAGDDHPLVGFKGIDLEIEGKPLIARLVESLTAFGGFDPIWIAGPKSIYRDAGIPVPVIDTDGGFGDNLQTAIEWVQSKLPGKPLGLITCDVLPSPEDLDRVMNDYRSTAPCALWGPLIRAPSDPKKLGAFGWKPRYKIKPKPGENPLNILPGHFAIIDPPGLRLPFAYHLFEIAYKTRNRSIAARTVTILRQVMFGILAQDFKKLCSGRKPNLTVSILRGGLRAARRLRDGTITRSELEGACRDMFVRTEWRENYPDRAISLPLIDGLSLARDIDTREEAEATGFESADTSRPA